jgi:hypothetical protein
MRRVLLTMLTVVAAGACTGSGSGAGSTAG